MPGEPENDYPMGDCLIDICTVENYSIEEVHCTTAWQVAMVFSVVKKLATGRTYPLMGGAPFQVDCFHPRLRFTPMNLVLAGALLATDSWLVSGVPPAKNPNEISFRCFRGD